MNRVSRPFCLQDVKDWKEKDPNQIDKVPKQAEGFNPIREPLAVFVPQGQPDREHIVLHHDDATENVSRVQAGDGVVDPKKCAVLRLICREAADVPGFNLDFVMMVSMVQP